jgi:hypothetical protein
MFAVAMGFGVRVKAKFMKFTISTGFLPADPAAESTSLPPVAAKASAAPSRGRIGAQFGIGVARRRRRMARLARESHGIAGGSHTPLGLKVSKFRIPRN